MSKNILIISDQIIKERTAIHGNIDPKLLYPDIKVAQDLFIHPILGTALFNKILNDIDGNTLSGDYKILVDDYIIDTLIWYVLSQLPVALSYQFWNKGVVRKQGEDTELPSMSDLVDISDRYKHRAESYAKRLRDYLMEYAPTKFSEYLNPGTGVDSIRPESNTFSMPLYIGDDDCRGAKSFEEKYQGNRPNCCD